jgi:uncharacterized membrane protein YjgN (DUF898 family)
MSNVEPISGETTHASENGFKRLSIEFTGSSRAFFNIWIVNLLLTLLTLSLYWPYARARRLRFFHNHTLIDGHPLGFHGLPSSMFISHLVLLATSAIYFATEYFLPAFDWVGTVIFLVLWPALWRASLKFRMLNTSWRGSRFSFAGDLKGAYQTVIPIFFPVLLIAVLPHLTPFIKDFPLSEARLIGGITILSLLMLPLLLAQLKRYQHGGYVFLSERTQLSTTTPQFYGLLVIQLTLFFGLMVLVICLGFADQLLPNKYHLNSTNRSLLTASLAYFLVVTVNYSSTVARFQNILWSGTASDRIRFSSNLGGFAYIGLSLKNWVLIVMTLGLFWPFAIISANRMRLSAMQIWVAESVESWEGPLSTPTQGVLGDATGDFFGLDLGI